MTSPGRRAEDDHAGSPSLGRLRRAGEACLWTLVIAATVFAVLWVAAKLRLVVLPVLLALVIASVLTPLSGWLKRHRWPDGLAALAVVVGWVLLILGTVGAVAPAVVSGFEELDVRLTGGLDEIQRWLNTGPLNLSNAQVDDAFNRLQDEIRNNVGSFAQGAMTGAFLVVEVIAGLVLALVLLFFFLKDGPQLWRWLSDLAPPRRRADVRSAGERAWGALAGFLRGQTIVALFDAAFIALALVIIGVPLVLPLAVLTFFGAYVPILGATIAGLAAVLVALFAEGPLAAALVLGAIVVVQQVEGNILQPFVVGRSVHVHPVVILLAVTGGAVLAGIIGAMVAAPVVAVVAAVLTYVREAAPPADAA